MKLTSSKLIKLSPLLLAVLVLTNFLFKGYCISHNAIAGDEPFSIFYAQPDVFTIIKELSIGNNPPLYEILLHFWIKLFGTSAIAVRSLSLIFSSIAVGFVFRLAQQFFNVQVAVYTSLLFILSNYQTIFAHEARVYSLLGLLCLISVFYYFRIIIKNDVSRSTVIKFIVVSTLLIYSHYFGFFILIVQFLFVLGTKELRLKYWRKLVLIAGIIFILYLPNTIVFIGRFLDSSSTGTWVSPTTDLGQLHAIIHLFSNDNPLAYVTMLILIWLGAGAYDYYSTISRFLKGLFLLFIFPLFFLTGISIFIRVPLLWVLTQSNIYVYFFLFFVFIFVLIVTFNQKFSKIDFQTKFIVFWLWFPFLLMFTMSLENFPYSIPMFFDRYLMIVAIAFYFFIGIIVNAIFRPSNFKTIVLPVVILFVFANSSKPYVDNERNVDQVVDKVNELKNENSLVLFSPKHFDLNLTYYLDNKLFKSSSSVEGLNKELKSKNVVGVNHIDDFNLAKWNHIIFIDAASEFSFPGNNILRMLSSKFQNVTKNDTIGVLNVYEFKIK